MRTITTVSYENLGEFLRPESNTIYACERCGAEFTDEIECVRHELEHLYQEEKDNFAIIVDGTQVWALPAIYADFEALLDELVYCDNTLEFVIDALTACELFMTMEEYGLADLPTKHNKAYMNRVGHYIASDTSWEYGRWYQYGTTQVFAESYDNAIAELASVCGQIDCAEVFTM